MSKRSATDVEDGKQAYLKRQKISGTIPSTSLQESIYSASQLRKILAFDQDAGRAKLGIQSFKGFLDSFGGPENDDAGRISILREYLDSQISSSGEDKDAVYISDLMKTWSFGSQSNNESLLSAIPAVLALLLRTISGHLELAEYGLRLGRTLLQKAQLELVARGITANKSKEFVISPVLRLLREMTILDGGTLAKQIFRSRDQTLRSLGRNLNLRYKGDGVEDRRKPSVRTNALRFILPLIKFLSADAKRDLFNQKDIVTGLTRDISDDPPFIVRDILETLRESVLQDEGLARDAKLKVINAFSLSRIATLYRYDQSEDDDYSEVKHTKLTPVETVAHEFLLIACTNNDSGILNHQSGFYPRGIDPDDSGDAEANNETIDLGLDNVEWMSRFTENIPVRNTALLEFINSLRPWSDTKQCDLLVSIFRAAPELIATYFLGKKDFSFEHKLTVTWIGYSAFVFSSLQLPIPPYFGHPKQYARLPPPTSIVLENILPEIANQKVMMRCFDQPHKIITFLAVRLLCVALSKFKKAIQMYHEAAKESSVWAQAAERLQEEFSTRCPPFQYLIRFFRNVPKSEYMQREAFSRLLVLYYEAIPRVALDAKFDVSDILFQVLLNRDETPQTPEERGLSAMELENLFQFAHFSPGMRWFSQAKGLTISPFMAMIKLSAEAPADFPLLKLRSVLDSVAQENQIFQMETSSSALDSFILGLRSLRGESAEADVYELLEECISRCTSKPVKYIFLLEELQAEAHSASEKHQPVSLLTLAILEQWQFVVKTASVETIQALADWIAQYLARSLKISEDKKVLKLVIERLAAATPAESSARKTITKAKKLVVTIEISEPRTKPTVSADIAIENGTPTESQKSEAMNRLAEATGAKTEDPGVLTKWITKEVDEVIEGGLAASLIRLLSSEYLSVRKEAATNITKLSAKLRESAFEEKEQIWLLLAEVVETAKKVIDQDPLPTIISSFASSAVAVLGDPLHCLYPKINNFLSQGPSWELDKVPLMYKILDDAPTLDDAHYLEIAWLLNYMLDALRLPADMSIYRKRRVFEKLFSLYNNPYLAPGLRTKIERIVFRATTIEGGSTTLVTRFSTMTWLQAQIALRKGVTLKVLLEQIIKSCDQGRVGAWSKNGAKEIASTSMIF